MNIQNWANIQFSTEPRTTMRQVLKKAQPDLWLGNLYKCSKITRLSNSISFKEQLEQSMDNRAPKTICISNRIWMYPGIYRALLKARERLQPWRWASWTCFSSSKVQEVETCRSFPKGMRQSEEHRMLPWKLVMSSLIQRNSALLVSDLIIQINNLLKTFQLFMPNQ